MPCRSRAAVRNLGLVWQPKSCFYAQTQYTPGSNSLFPSRSLHISSTFTSQRTTSEIFTNDTPLKISANPGDKPPPEDPDDFSNSKDNKGNHNEGNAHRLSPSSSFARSPSSKVRGRKPSNRDTTPMRQRHIKTNQSACDLPNWFLTRNVVLADEVRGKDDALIDVPSKSGYRISVSSSIRKEILAHLSAGLLSESAPRTSGISRKVHVFLQCADRGALYLLDEIVEDAARELNADMVRLDSQDLHELLGDVPEPPVAEIGFSVPSIAFANVIQGEVKDVVSRKHESSAEEEMEGMEDEEAFEDKTPARLPPEIPHRLLRLLAARPLFASLGNFYPGTDSGLLSSDRQSTQSKTSAYIDAILSAATTKRKSSVNEIRAQDNVAQSNEQKCHNTRTILYLRDFQSLLDSSAGQIIHQNLLKAIASCRRLGQKILLVVSNDRPSESILTMPFFIPYYHLLKIPPPMTEAEKSILRADHYSRTREINLRNLQYAIRQRCGTQPIEFDCPAGIHLDGHATSSIRDLSRHIWDIDHVQRIASVAIGNNARHLTCDKDHAMRFLSIANIAEASEDIALADEQAVENHRIEKINNGQDPDIKDVDNSGRAGEDQRLPPLNSKDYNKHEQKLLSGVIDPDKINVRFSDIRAPPSTIETLKILVSLPLKRPDAFTYGVLERNFINGVLLFGPPGTGKTMLAKAVAKESGARVLEIKGSEVYDMYVGEGEKNVKAIFSLARKLNPCVVFIDEVDTIFSSRNSSERHVSHREIINQFMAEWDGINTLNSGILILGATNRPFDLDDAILRRMPRRILVDLPSEEDRHAILHLLLTGEQLDSTVNLEDLAKRTNLYSGSDLKNVCVSAAVAAVIDDNQITFGSPPNDANVTEKMERRVLRKSHFEKALLEVTPSISESMETIEMLRKFDKEYGNVRDKKKTVMGFGSKVEEAVANVRTLNL